MTPAVRLNLPFTPCLAGTLIVACALALPALLDVAVELFVSEPAGASESTFALIVSVFEPVRSPTSQQALPSRIVALPSEA